MQELKGVAGGRLVVTVISAGDYFFPHLLTAFVQDRTHPGVTFDLRVSNRSGLLRQVEENQTDLGVMGRAPQDRDMVAEAFAPHPYVVVAPPGHPLAAKRRIALPTLLREAFVVREAGSDTHRAMAKCFGAGIERMRVAMEIGSNETIKQAVTAGMGIAFLSAYAVSLEVEAGRLAILDVRGFPHMESWYVVHRRGKRLPPVANAFKDFLRTNGAAMLESFARGGTAPGGRRRS
jgi:DNA-binding transcriptional LysR family regulator